MKKSEIKVGGHYTAKVNGKLVTVRVDEIREGGFTKGGSQTAFDVTNLATGRKTTFRSAAKFRSPAKGPTPASIRHKNGEESDPLAPEAGDEQCSDPTSVKGGADTFSCHSTVGVPVATSTRVTCPRCGLAVTITDGRYGYHKHATKGITCGMSGERVTYAETPRQERDRLVKGRQHGRYLTEGCAARIDELTEIINAPEEGEQSVDYGPSPLVKALPAFRDLEEIDKARVEAFSRGATPPEEPASGLLSKLRSTPVTATPPHVIVTARAGTGKTTTLIEGLKRMRGLPTSITPSPQQQAVWDQLMLSKDAKTVCFVAFNRSIAQELKDRVPPGCEASTMHSMGLKAVTRAFGRLEISEYVVPDLIAELLSTDLRELRKEQPVLLKATADLVSLCKMNLTMMYSSKVLEDLDEADIQKGWDEDLSALASHYDVDLDRSRRQIFDLVPQVLDRCRDPKRQGRIDYDDMIWLPVALDLPVFRHDLLLVDEAQDLNRCQQALAKKAGKRLILVGDERQAIYGFAGADSESIPRMVRELSSTDCCGGNGAVVCEHGRGCVVLPLTVTRRCGKRIVVEAQRYVPDFEAHESNPEGEVKAALYPRYKDRDGIWQERPWEQTYGPAVKEGDMVLCRTNAPLVSQCFRFLKLGIKANIQGRDVGQGLVALVKKSKASMVSDLLLYLEHWHDAERAKENAKKNPSEAKLTAVADRYQCLLCFAEGLTTVEEVVAKIESVFTDDKQKPGVKFSSVHKAKGLEARNVFILCPPEGGPRTDRMKPWGLQQEDNIQYVAITRAIDVLTYVG